MRNTLQGHILYIRHSTPDSFIMRIRLSEPTIEEVLRVVFKNHAQILTYYTSSQARAKFISTFSIDGPGSLIKLNHDMSLGKAFNVHVRAPALSPDGQTLAYLVSPPLGCIEQSLNVVNDWRLFLLNLRSGSFRKISERSCFHMKPSWFPDGKHLAVGSKDLNIYMIDLLTGEERKIIDFGVGPVVSPDGTKIAYLSKDACRAVKDRMVAFQTRTTEEYCQEYRNKMTDREESEFSKNFLKYSIYIYDIKTKSSRKITPEIPIEESVVWSPDSQYLSYNDRTHFYEYIYILNPATCAAERIDNANGRVMAWEK